MKLQKAVRTETLHIAAGTAALGAVMLAVFAVCGRFGLPVVFGALLGCCWAVLNFLLLGITVQKAASEPQARAKSWMQFSYSLRMLGSAIIMILGFTLPWLNAVAVAVPLLFPRVTILIMQLTGRYKPEKTGAEGGEE